MDVQAVFQPGIFIRVNINVSWKNYVRTSVQDIRYTLTLTARVDLMRQTGFSFVEINSHLYDFEVNEGH